MAPYVFGIWMHIFFVPNLQPSLDKLALNLLNASLLTILELWRDIVV